MSDNILSDRIKRIVKVDEKFTEYNNFRALRLEDGAIEKKYFGNAIGFRDRTHTASYYNRVINFSEIDIEMFDAIYHYYKKIGKTPTITITSNNVTPKLLNALRENGYFIVDTNYIFAETSHHLKNEKTSIEIKRASSEDIDVIVDLWSVEYDERVAENIVKRRAKAQWVPEFPLYLAIVDGEIAAMAGMYIADGVAWFGNANTFPKFRCRGCQKALIYHRIKEAKQMKCDLIVSDTQFGTTSYRNLERVGLKFISMDMEFTTTV